MTSLKGILKYTIYFFIVAWMFVLGIMVGRGNAPVSFDTNKFQKRLEKIALEFGRKETDKKQQVDLKFYKVLDQPAAVETASSKTVPKEIVPIKPQPDGTVEIPKKESTKKKTVQKKAGTQVKKEPAPPAVPVAAEIKKEPERYTLQIAAFKNLEDARVQMAVLKKKGISSYRVRTVKQGVVWYRIRSGAFATFNQAKAYKEKLSRMKISSMIIKKDDNENIKR